MIECRPPLTVSGLHTISTPLSRELRTERWEEGEAEILAAILSCAYSYEVIARNILQSNPDSIHHEFYGDWIKGYVSDEYSQENVVLFEMLERLTTHYTEEQKEHLVDIYVACSRYELAFWELSWNMST